MTSNNFAMLLNNNLAEIELSYKPELERMNRIYIKSSFDAFKTMFSLFDTNTIALKEQFSVLFLNRSNVVLGYHTLSVGGISGTIADPKLILGIALKCAATGIVLAHNHPSCNTQPSKQDEVLTLKIKEAAKFMDITVMDHLIITPDGNYFSFTDEGLI